MQSVSSQIAVNVLYLLFPLVVGGVLFVLARRTRSAGLWWLFVALGVWPFVGMLLRQAAAILVAARVPPSEFTSYVLGIGAVIALVSTVLQIAACVKLARAQTMPPTEPLCPRCGYNLTGLENNRCPECGTQFVCEVRYLTRAA